MQIIFQIILPLPLKMLSFFKPLKMAVLFVSKSNSPFFPPLLQKSIVSADILNEVVALIIFRR